MRDRAILFIVLVPIAIVFVLFLGMLASSISIIARDHSNMLMEFGLQILNGIPVILVGTAAVLAIMWGVLALHSRLVKRFTKLDRLLRSFWSGVKAVGTILSACLVAYILLVGMLRACSSGGSSCSAGAARYGVC